MSPRPMLLLPLRPSLLDRGSASPSGRRWCQARRRPWGGLLVTALLLLQTSGCGGGDATGPTTEEPARPAVAGTYRLSGTQTTSNGPGVSFDGTLTLTQGDRGVLGGTATLTFSGGALGSGTRAFSGGPVEGDAITVVAPAPEPGGFVSIKIRDQFPSTQTALWLVGRVGVGGALSGTLDIALEPAVTSGVGTWRADRQ